MACLALRVLGPVQVEVDGLPVPLRNRKALLLLAYLALQPGTHARETLAALFWPDSAPAVARAALRNALAALRHGLGLSADRLHTDTSTVTVQLQPEDVVDLQLLRAGDVTAWRNELLDGHTAAGDLGAWLDGQREAARAAADRAFDLAVRSALDHQPGRAADLAEQRLALDRLNEAAWRQLILARHRACEDALAHAAYRACRQVLREELGEEPAPETQAILAPAPRARADRPPIRRSASLVGRAAEVSAFRRHYEDTVRGRPQVLVLEGEPGIGKSRLAAELLAWASAQGAQVLCGLAAEVDSTPFAAFVEGLQSAPDLLHRLSMEQRSRLAPLLAAGGMMDAALPPDLDPRRLPWALSDALLAAAGGEPTVLLLEDLHWADGGTLDAARHLTVRLAKAPAPLLLLITARAEALAFGAPLAAWLARIQRDLPITRLALGPLGAGETAQVLAELTGSPASSVPKGLQDWLYGRTAGQPLYLTETIRDLLGRGALSLKGVEWRLDLAHVVGVAPGVQAAIGERLARLSPAGVAVAQALAVLPGGAPFTLVAQVAGLESGAALEGHEAMLRAGLLVEGGGPDATWVRLSHDRVREVMYGDLSTPRRQLLHRRAFDAGQAVQLPAATLAHHALQAGLPDEAGHWLVTAANVALSVGRYDAALDALEDALRLTPACPSQAQPRAVLLNRIRIALYLRDGAFEVALSRMQQAERFAREHHLPLEEAAALRLQARLHSAKGAYEEARVVARGALQLAQAWGAPREALEATIALGTAALFQHDLQAAQAVFDQAHRMAGALQDPYFQVRTARHQAVTLAHQGEVRAARDLALNAVRTMSGPGGPNAQLEAQHQWEASELLTVVLAADLVLGAYDEALDHADLLRPWMQLQGRPAAAGHQALHRGVARLLGGDVRGAVEELRVAEQVFAQAHAPPAVAKAALACGLAQLGQAGPARQALTEADAMFSMDEDVYERSAALRWMADASLALQDLSAAERYAWRALDGRFVDAWLTGLRVLGEVRAQQGRADEAAALLEVVLAHPWAGAEPHRRARRTCQALGRNMPVAPDVGWAARAEHLRATVHDFLSRRATLFAPASRSASPKDTALDDRGPDVTDVP